MQGVSVSERSKDNSNNNNKEERKGGKDKNKPRV